MAEIFKEKPKQGMPFCTPGLMDGLARLEYAVKNIKGEGCTISWSGLGAPMITVEGGGGGGADFDAMFEFKSAAIVSSNLEVVFTTKNVSSGDAGTNITAKIPVVLFSD